MVELQSRDSFELQKRKALERADLSKKGSVDVEIKHVIEMLNSSENYYTTSSCAGRIVLLRIPKSGRKDQSEWLYISHKPAKFADIKKIIKKLPKDSVWFKQESAIFHIAAFDFVMAEQLLDAARMSGLKHSGIISTNKRIIVEIFGNDKIEAIIADKGKLLVSEAYTKRLISEANKKMKRNRAHVERFYELIKKS